MSLLSSVRPKRIIASPLAFKNRLQIGEQAFAMLSRKEHLHSLLLAGGGAATGAGAASSALVAGTFFAPTGLAAWLGLATAATPVGWVLAAAVLTGGSFLAVGKLAADKSLHTDLVPKYINTPLDALGQGLMELMGGLVVRVAMADGEFHQAERAAIVDTLCSEWGYDADYVVQAIAALEKDANPATISEMSARLAKFQASNPDCNNAAMQHSLLEFVREIVMADGVLRQVEEQALVEIANVFVA